MSRCDGDGGRLRPVHNGEADDQTVGLGARPERGPPGVWPHHEGEPPSPGFGHVPMLKGAQTIKTPGFRAVRQGQICRHPAVWPSVETEDAARSGQVHDLSHGCGLGCRAGLGRNGGRRAVGDGGGVVRLGRASGKRVLAGLLCRWRPRVTGGDEQGGPETQAETWRKNLPDMWIISASGSAFSDAKASASPLTSRRATPTATPCPYLTSSTCPPPVRRTRPGWVLIWVKPPSAWRPPTPAA